LKSYLSIPGPRDCPIGRPCIAFYKHDGSNLRFDWSKKQGWFRFGTRRRLFDHTDPDFGGAIEIFQNKYADAIAKIIKDDKDYRGVRSCLVFCEYEGPSSFAGYHDPDEPKDLILLDVNPHKKGIVVPRTFLKKFGHLHIPEVVYEGNFNRDFMRAVREGEFDVKEGVVAKGLKPGGHPQHSLWMAKVKTKWWLDELRKRAEEDERLKLVLEENEREQCES